MKTGKRLWVFGLCFSEREKKKREGRERLRFKCGRVMFRCSVYTNHSNQSAEIESQRGRERRKEDEHGPIYP